MLKRKIAKNIEEHFSSNDGTALLIDGARQVGKTYIINHVAQKFFKNYIEINMLEDSLNKREFEDVKSTEDFYFQVSTSFGDKLNTYQDTVIFIDEIQAYPHLLTLLKFLVDDKKYHFIASGSMLGVALSKTLSIPMGRIKTLRMYPLDFEEFLLANNYSKSAIKTLKDKFMNKQTLSEANHNKLLDLFKKYLIVGGLPRAVDEFVKTTNVYSVRTIQDTIYEYYKIDAAQYSKENKLKIQELYTSVVSFMENKKKRVFYKNIENENGKRFENYKDEILYILSSGICLGVNAISDPKFPLAQSFSKNLIKLYFNDAGIFSNLLYKTNIDAIMKDIKTINLGALYETVVACELAAHKDNLYYYDNRNKGEVDFLVDDHSDLSIIPIEVKSGRDYSIHSALNNLTSNQSYNIKSAYVLSNNRDIYTNGKIIYSPIYNIMFI